jgi:TIR domain
MSEDSDIQASSGRDVFVSYASQDAAVANAVVEHLEQHGIRCWVAPRDVKPGAQYADAIVRAINEAKTMVLVLSQSSVGSSHVGREIERAASKHKQVIALKIDAAALTPAVRGVVVFPGWFVEQRSERGPVWVLGPKMLPGFIEQEPVSVSPADVALAAFHLSRYVRSEAKRVA